MKISTQEKVVILCKLSYRFFSSNTLRFNDSFGTRTNQWASWFVGYDYDHCTSCFYPCCQNFSRSTKISAKTGRTICTLLGAARSGNELIFSIATCKIKLRRTVQLTKSLDLLLDGIYYVSLIVSFPLRHQKVSWVWIWPQSRTRT